MADTYTVTRETRIAAPPVRVWERLVDLRRWREWSPFEGLDPDMERTYAGSPSGVGQTYDWKGNLKAGTGHLEVSAARPVTSLVVEQRNLKPLKSTSTSTFTLTPDGEGTALSWSSTGPVTGAMRVMGLFTSMEKVLTPVFDEALANLKEAVEK